MSEFQKRRAALWAEFPAESAEYESEFGALAARLAEERKYRAEAVDAATSFKARLREEAEVWSDALLKKELERDSYKARLAAAEAVAAADGTLHGAIDHWRDRAAKAEELIAVIARGFSSSDHACTWPECRCKRGSAHECAQGYVRPADSKEGER